jgi:hypothetical protein
VLNSPTGEIQDYLKPFLDNFNASEFVVNLLREFVLAEDRLNSISLKLDSETLFSTIYFNSSSLSSINLSNNWSLCDDFLQTYAYFVLNSPTGEIQDYLKPFLDNFNASEFVVDLFRE